MNPPPRWRRHDGGAQAPPHDRLGSCPILGGNEQVKVSRLRKGSRMGCLDKHVRRHPARLLPSPLPGPAELRHALAVRRPPISGWRFAEPQYM